MATYAYDTVVYGSSEHGIFFALAAVESGARVAIISETNTIGGMTGGSLGVQDISGAAMLAAMRGGEYGRYIRLSAFDLGLRDTRLIVPSMAEQLYIRMLGRAGVDVHRSQQLASAVVNGSNKITSITMVSGDVFTATTFFDASMCNDLVQMAGTEGVTWQIGTEAASTYGESKGGYQASDAITGSVYDGMDYDRLAIADPGLATGAAYDGVQSYAYRVIYAPAGESTPFTSAVIKQLSTGTDISVMDPTIYNPDDFAFYGLTRAAERGWAVDQLVGAGRGFMPNSLIQDNDDIPLAASGRPRHWDYAKLNKDNPAATYATRAQLEYDVKLFMMQSRAWMQTDSRYSGAWQDSAPKWGWPQREFRSNDGMPWQFYIREGVRPIGGYVLAQDDLTVVSGGTRNINKTDAISLAGFLFDTHISAYSAAGLSTTQYRQIGKTPSGAPDTYSGGYAIPWSACYNSARPNLMHVPSCSHVAWSSARLVQNLCLAAEACGAANKYLLAQATLDPASIDIAALQAELTARGLLIEPV